MKGAQPGVLGEEWWCWALRSREEELGREEQGGVGRRARFRLEMRVTGEEKIQKHLCCGLHLKIASFPLSPQSLHFWLPFSAPLIHVYLED